MARLRRFLRGEHGATAVEYGIMFALIAAVIIGLVVVFSQQVEAGLDDEPEALNEAGDEGDRAG